MEDDAIQNETIENFNIDEIAFHFDDENHVTFRDLCSGVQVFGGTGSGKSSGSGKKLATSILKPGIGGLILTVKPDESEYWVDLAQKAGYSEDDIVLFNTKSGHSFDFLKYELERNGDGAGRTINLLNIFRVIGEMTRPDMKSGGNEDSYWEQAALDMIKHSIDYLKYSDQSISISTISDFITNIPQSKDVVADKNWLETSLLVKFDNIHDSIKANLSTGQIRDYDAAFRFATHDFPTLNDRTRSSVENRGRAMYSPFMTGELADLFSNNEVTVKPEDTFDGKLIIIDMPVLEWGVLGRIAQGIWKFLFQKAVERRAQKDKPVFLWADEAHYFVNEHDQLFLTTARSAQCITVFLTQNINNYITIVGKEKTSSILGNLQLKIFHQNSDVDTNEYASKIIGKRWMKTKTVATNFASTLGSSYSESKTVGSSDSIGSSESAGGLGSTTNYTTSSSRGSTATESESDTRGYSANIAYLREFLVQPEEFNLLARGGPDFENKVSGVIYQGGRLWSNKEMAIHVVFEQ